MLDVLQIGASRAGSTWLWRMLQKHPQVVFPVWGPNAAPGGGPAYSRKSGWFWNNTSSFWKDNHWGQIKPRAIMNLDEYREWYDSSEDGKIKMDVTEGAAYIPDSRIKLIRDTYPNVKIMYCVRNPITTTWSHMSYSNQTNIGVKRFLQGRGGNYRKNVNYLVNLKQWEKHFPQDQIKVYFFNRIKDNPLDLLEELTTFMGVDASVWNQLPQQEITTAVNKGNGKHIPGDIKQGLVATFKQQIQDMEKHFNTDLSHWYEGKE